MNYSNDYVLKTSDGKYYTGRVGADAWVSSNTSEAVTYTLIEAERKVTLVAFRNFTVEKIT